MAFRPDAHRALLRYVEEASGRAQPHKGTIQDAVLLTEAQQAAIAILLQAYWNNPAYVCPLMLDVKPQHGYRSRVLKDGFSPEQYAEWLVAGCSDVSCVGQDDSGRPNLILQGVQDGAAVYDVLVPVRSDALGYVHVDDVIPKGLRPRKRP